MMFRNGQIRVELAFEQAQRSEFQRPSRVMTDSLEVCFGVLSHVTLAISSAHGLYSQSSLRKSP